MSIFVLGKELVFPPVHLSEPDGLLAIGGDLSPERLLKAYRAGIFPWYEGDHILWWSPDPRCVLFPSELKISDSMNRLIRKKSFDFTVNNNFSSVIHHCRIMNRKGQESTWITEEVESAYNIMHQLGYAHSAEAWANGKLVGGLYGIVLGKVFFGESMFITINNASKYAFIQFVRYFEQHEVELIDCQVHSPHMESLGAKMIQRSEFIGLLEELI